MSHFDQLFTHFSEYRVVVYRQCQFAVVPAQVSRYLQDHHPAVSKESQGKVVGTFQHAQDVAYTKKDIQYPDSKCSPVPGLPVYTDGFSVPKGDVNTFVAD